MMPFACRRAAWVFALLASDSSALGAGPPTRRARITALSAGPLARRPRPWRRRLLSQPPRVEDIAPSSQPSDDAAPARPKRIRKLLVPISVGGLAAVELSTSLWELGHHHGLAMLALSRGAHAVTDLTQSGADAVETVVEVVSEVGAEAAAAVRTHSTRLSSFFTPKRIRNLSIAALFAAAWEVYQDLRPGGHHGMVLLAAHDLVDTGTRASTRLARFLGSRWLKLTMAVVALGFAVVELVEDFLPGAHHGVAVLAFANCVAGVAELTAAREPTPA